MKKIIFLVTLVSFFYNGFSQATGSRPTKSRFYNNRYKTFSIKEGDILIYKIYKDTIQADLVVTVKKYNNVIQLNYIINKLEKSGTILIPEKAVNMASKYDTLITDSTTTLKDEIVFWLSQKNFKELYYVKESILDMGNGPETFARGNTSIMKINIKGRESFITLFNNENKNKKSKKYISVLTDDKNPLIIKMDAGNYSMLLKEVR